jgi:uncharacterized linocin/CFP29 family protein
MQFGIDYIHNDGSAEGDIAAMLIASGGDIGAMRPYIWNGKHYRPMWNRQKQKLEAVPLQNATATLSYEAWKKIDREVAQEAQRPMNAVADLRQRGLVETWSNGYATMTYVSQAMSGMGKAIVSMDGLDENENDRQQFKSTPTPMPVIHAGFSMSAREIAAAAQSGQPIDTSGLAECGRVVSEKIEELTLGAVTGPTYNGGTVYGYQNFPYINTTTITSPEAGGWDPETAVANVNSMIQALIDDRRFGPYVLYYGPAWSEYMNKDFKTYGDRTLAQRLRDNDGLDAVRMAHFIDDYSLILVQMDKGTVRLLNGMEIMTVQYDTRGGALKNFTVMAVQSPQVRATYDGHCGVCVGSV